MDIKLQAYLRRLKNGSSQAVTKPTVEPLANSNTGPQLVTVGEYDPATDKRLGTLPDGQIVEMESITNGSVGTGQQVVYEAGFYNSMPAR